MSNEEKKSLEILKSVRISLMNFNEVTEENKKVIASIQTIVNLIEKQEKENTDLKELYIRTAKHQEKIGHTELADYMLAQIQAVPTFTTWEEYTTWVSKEDLRKILDKYKNKKIDYAPMLYKELRTMVEE
jgi:hypothetical protein